MLDNIALPQTIEWRTKKLLGAEFSLQYHLKELEAFATRNSLTLNKNKLTITIEDSGKNHIATISVDKDSDLQLKTNSQLQQSVFNELESIVDDLKQTKDDAWESSCEVMTKLSDAELDKLIDDYSEYFPAAEGILFLG